MSYPIYKINIHEENTILNFCLKDDMDNNPNNKCMNMFIYEDDILIEVINKIKIGIINHIQSYKDTKFENISGYLTAKWNYYDDIFKLKEYVYLNIFNEDKSSINNFTKKLAKINKQYNVEDFINNQNIDDDNITINNIDFNKFKNIEEDNEIVIGYYDSNNVNFFKYYITKNEMINNIGRIVENELNKPINSYYNIIKTNILENIFSNILEYKFYIVKEPEFIKNNYTYLPTYLLNIETKEFMENIYNINNENRIKLDSTYEEIFCDDLIDNISYLSLEIHNYEYIDFISKYNSIELNEYMPMCLLSQKEKGKTSKKYKLFRNSNKLPFIKEHQLTDIIEQIKNINKNYTLFKIYFLKNRKKTIYFVDVYLVDETCYYIKFNNINQKIKMIDIVENINNVLQLLNLQISGKNTITLEELYYYNDNNTIQLNDPNDFNSNKINLMIKNSYINTTEFESEKLLYFVSVFNTFFDVEIQEPLKILIKKEIKKKSEIEIKKELKIIQHLGTEKGKQKIKITGKTTNLEDIDYLKIKNNKKIKLFYKKSYNYDSFNYIEKYFKYIITFKENEIKKNFKCNDSEDYTKFLENNGETPINILDTEIEINTIKQSLKEYIDTFKSIKINKLATPYCENIKKKTNKKCSITIDNISTGIFVMDLENIYSFKDLLNLCKFFNMYTNYSRLYNRYYNFKNNDRLLLSINPYIESGKYIYNVYNSIFNKYNILHPLNENIKKSFYIYSIYNHFLNKIVPDTDVDSDEVDLDDIDIDEISDEEEEEIIEVENYTMKNYIRMRKDSDNRWNNIMKKHFTGPEKELKTACRNENRPSVISSDTLKIILENEANNKIHINKRTAKPFTDFFAFNANEITLENFKKTPLLMFMGREYKININNQPSTDKKVLLLEDSNTFISEYNETNTDINVYLEIKNKNTDNVITLEDYLESEENEFEFIINFPLTEFNQENIEKNINKIYKFGIYEKTNVFKNTSQKIELKMPEKYYYNNKIYDDNYFVFIPDNGEINSPGLKAPRIKDNIICCYVEGRAQQGAPSIYKNLEQNQEKDLEYIPNTIWNEEIFHLPKFKMGKIPDAIYDNISKFLSLSSKKDEYYKNKIMSKQPYRFGILKNVNINNFLHCILIIIKASQTKHLTSKIKTLFDLNNIEKSVQISVIKKGFINCINDNEILNDEALIKLNNNVFYKNEKIKNILNIVQQKSKQKETQKNFNNSTLNDIRKKMIEYIESSFLNMDIYFIWNLCSIIFNINIIIFELEFKGNTLENNIKCPLVNNYKLYEFDKSRKTCFIFKFNNVYQPLTIPEGNIQSGFNYKILFNINENSNITNLFNKCLLKYNNNTYNTLLINSIYHNIDYTNNILLDTEDIYLLKEYIKYIIINEDYIKLGIVFQVNEDYLFIPINFLKHNINYSIINKNIEYKYIYSNEGKQFIHTFEDTQNLIKEFFDIHKIDKLQLNNKYITKNDKIIGMGLLIGDYIPIQSINIIDTPIEIESELKPIDGEGDISYINIEDDLEMYNKFEYTNLYYTQFIYSILHIIQNTEIKKNINRLIQQDDNTNDEEKLTELIEFLKNKLNELFKINEKMYLENKKPTFELEAHIVSCHTLQIDNCEINNENCVIESDKCKYIITQEYYDLFVKFLANDLYYNHYKRNLLLSLKKTNNLSTIDTDKYIVFEEEKNDKNRKILKEKINNIYNKIITDDHYYSIGETYNKTEINIKNINSKYCQVPKYIDSLKITYYAMKSLTKKNIIAYSNCIYYNLSKLNNINTLDMRTLIANEIVKNIKNKNFNFYDIINYYSDHNNSHLYTNIITSEDLFNVLITSEHWMTEFDLYIYSQLYKKKILFYKLNAEKHPNYKKGCYMIMNEKNEGFDEIEIYVEDFYHRKLYYLIIR